MEPPTPRLHLSCDFGLTVLVYFSVANAEALLSGDCVATSEELTFSRSYLPGLQ